MKLQLHLLLLAVALVLSSARMSAAEAEVIMSEDFSAFTEGTIEEPGTEDISSYSSNKLRNTLTGWTGKNVFEAGGALLVGDGGNLQTARYNMSTADGNSKVTVRLKAQESYGNYVAIYVGFSVAKNVMLTDDQWTTVTVITGNGTSSSYIKVQPTFGGVFVDDMKVERSKDFVPVPTPYQPTNATGTSFTASWTRVTGASYLLSVYTKDATGNRTYVMQDEEVTTNSKSVTGLDATATHYFTVKAKIGEIISEESEEIRVVKKIAELPAPEVTPASEVTSTSFKANWNAVEDAYEYKVNLYSIESITESTTKEILSEDFSGVTKGTTTSVEFGKLESDLDDCTKQPGWYSIYPAFAKGYLVLAPFGTTASVLETPVMDLSKNCEATIKMAEMNYGTYYQDAVVNVSMVNVDSEGTETIAETKDVTIDAKEFKDYVVTFTTGSTNSYIKISFLGTNKVFIDEVTMTKAFEAGDEFKSLIANEKTSDTSKTFTVENKANMKYGYTVVAYAETVTSSGEIDDIASKESAMQVVELLSGVEGVEGASNRVYSDGHSLQLSLTKAAQVEIYDMSGRLISKGQYGAGLSTIEVAKGMVIVNVKGDKAYKVKM